MKHFSSTLVAALLLLSLTQQAQLYIKQAYRPVQAPYTALNSQFLLPQPDNCMLNFGTVNPDALISKYDSTGSWLWTRTYAFGGGFYVRAGFNDAANSLDSTFAAIGSKGSGNGLYTGFCLKFNPNGDTVWCRTIVTPGSISMTPRSICATLDSGYVICGTTKTVIASNNQRAFVAKLTKNGTLSWVKTLSGPYTSQAYAVKQTADSGYIFTGEHGGSTNWNGFLAKLDKSGNLSWQRNYWDGNSPISGQFSGLDVLVENNGYLCLINVTDNRPMLLKTDLKGKPVWRKTHDLLPTYILDHSLDERPLRLKTLSADRRLVIGKAEGFGKSWLMIIDTAGNRLMHAFPHFIDVDAAPFKNKHLAVSGNRAYLPNSIPITPGETGFIVTDSLGTGSGACGYQYTLSESVDALDSITVLSTVISGGSLAAIHPTLGVMSLTVVGGCMMSQPVGIGENVASFLVQVYPNPSTGKITLQSEALQEQELRFVVQDISGRTLLEKTLSAGGNTASIDLQELVPALYIYTLYSGNALLKTDKLLISK